MMSTKEVNSRETYLKFRKEWRNAYRALSSEIQAARKISRAPQTSSDDRSAAQSQKYWLRIKARKMMEQIAEVKLKRPNLHKLAA